MKWVVNAGDVSCCTTLNKVITLTPSLESKSKVTLESILIQLQDDSIIAAWFKRIKKIIVIRKQEIVCTRSITARKVGKQEMAWNRIIRHKGSRTGQIR